MKFQLLTNFLLLILISSSPPSNATSPEPVYDTDGHPLIPKQQYYILPVIRGRGGGLTVTEHHKSCPLYVAQEKMEVNRGLPLLFRSVNPKDTAIRLETDLNIEFAAVTICVQSTVWRLGDVEGDKGTRFVITGGVSGSPGLETVSNWFKIEKLGKNEYKIVFCPSVCKTCKVVCGDVGVVSEGGNRFLGLSDVPFPVMFKRKDD
ncbi:hypothetical protein LUZ60_016598 [Juncus effusus]|nr:hypothetical protein LUZ60_016598 [Juncus effusus]